MGAGTGVFTQFTSIELSLSNNTVKTMLIPREQYSSSNTELYRSVFIENNINLTFDLEQTGEAPGVKLTVLTDPKLSKDWITPSVISLFIENTDTSSWFLTKNEALNTIVRPNGDTVYFQNPLYSLQVGGYDIIYKFNYSISPTRATETVVELEFGLVIVGDLATPNVKISITGVVVKVTPPTGGGTLT